MSYPAQYPKLPDDDEWVEGDDNDDNQNEDSIEDEGDLEGEAQASANVKKSGRRSTKGRQLKRWDADEDQLLLLWCDHTCTQLGTPMPWDAIAAAMEPRDPENGEMPMTGEAIKQHLAKLRDHRVDNGFIVPPKLGRSARRQAAGAKAARLGGINNGLLTPTKTPKKKAADESLTAGPSARGKAQAEKPAKESTLLASVSKSKLKKAEQNKKSQMGSSGKAAVAVAGAVAAGETKQVTGKRGRKPAATKLEQRNGNEIEQPAPKRQLRHPEPKNYAGLSVGGKTGNKGVKDEPESDDDLPLSKKTRVARKSTVKKGQSGLFDDTVKIWNNANIAAGLNAQSPIGEVASNTQQNVGMPTQQYGEYQGAATSHYQSAAGIESQDFNTHHVYQDFAGLPLELHGDTSQQAYNRALASSQIGYFNQHANGQAVGQANNNDYLPASSPLHDDFSSYTMSGADYGQSLGSGYSNLGSGSTSMSSSFSVDQELSDPFGIHSFQLNQGYAGLPTATADAGGNAWPANSSYQAMNPAAVSSMNHSFPDYMGAHDSFNFPSHTPNMMGSSVPRSQAYANTVSTPGLSDADFTLPSNEAFLDPTIAHHVAPSIEPGVFDPDQHDDQMIESIFNQFVDDAQ